MVELFDGEVPLSVVGLKPSFPHLPKGRVTQEILKAFNKLVANPPHFVSSCWNLITIFISRMVAAWEASKSARRTFKFRC